MKLSDDVLVFLRELKDNNNRAWFATQKPRFLHIQDELIGFIAELLPKLAQFDERMLDIAPKNCLFRIYRDARFSTDKSPYKTHFGIHMVTSGDRADFARAGFYLHIEPGNSMLAGGAHAPPSSWLRRIRENLAEHGDEWAKIVRSASFKKTFGTLQGEQLQRNPQGYAADHPQIEWLKYKTLTVMHPLTDEAVLSSQLLPHAVKVFRAYLPVRDFLNRA